MLLAVGTGLVISLQLVVTAAEGLLVVESVGNMLGNLGLEEPVLVVLMSVESFRFVVKLAVGKEQVTLQLVDAVVGTMMGILLLAGVVGTMMVTWQFVGAVGTKREILQLEGFAETEMGTLGFAGPVGTVLKILKIAGLADGNVLVQIPAHGFVR